jgi:hypothetical protein
MREARIETVVAIEDDERNQIDGIGRVAEEDTEASEWGCDLCGTEDEAGCDHGGGNAPEEDAIPTESTVENVPRVAEVVVEEEEGG